MPRQPTRAQPSLANDAWEALLTAHAVVMKRFAAEDIWGDVSMREYDVLYTLSKCPEPINMTELNRHVLLSQPALSRLVDRLAEQDVPVQLGQAQRFRVLGQRVEHVVLPHGHVRPDVLGGELAQLETICRKLAWANDKDEVSIS